MISRTDVVPKAATACPSTLHSPVRRRGFIWLLPLSAWCGTVAGLVEVGAIILRKGLVDPDRLYGMSHHFVWLIPLSNAFVFLTLGLLGCGVILVWPRGSLAVARVSCAVTLLPFLLVAFPRIYTLAWLVVALGWQCASFRLLSQESRFPAIRPVQFPGGLRDSGGPGWIDLGGRPPQAIAREFAAVAAARVAKRPLDRDGHRRGGPPEPARLRPGHQPDLGRARRARHHLCRRAGGLIVDAAVSCKHVYRTMATRALGRLAHTA